MVLVTDHETIQALWLSAVMLPGTIQDKDGIMKARTRGNSSPIPSPGMMCLLPTTPQPMVKGNGIIK